jgi:hypothetical protein
VDSVAELEFACLGAQPDRGAAAPTLLFELRIGETTGVAVQTIALRCQIRILPHLRPYSDTEAEAVVDLFGDRSRWSTTLKPLQLATVTQIIPGFRDTVGVELPVPCSYDFDVAAHKYFYALEQGEVPLLMLFSGTVFTAGPNGMAVEPVPWHKDVSYRLPVAAWREAMDHHFPGTAWLRLRHDAFDALYRYRARNGLATWEEALENLLGGAR